MNQTFSSLESGLKNEISENMDGSTAPVEIAATNPFQEALAIIPQALAISDDIEFIETTNTEFEQPTRLEPRRNKKGNLRGIAWRERNKERKAVYYVGAKSKGQRKKQYDELRPAFEALAGRDDAGASVGSRLDRFTTVGDEQGSRYIQ